ncbi:hypothetical protein P43SY_005040 [Pythium insidiosum]|uniref:WW domain-containing oxidoreductase n=1 Tax=Pythium insidiosum TaxID=114742 RepID=A0AAD5LP29_PYTIN|nr:hypothetical protein P43SY_005040 [Pythium insidiosum]
MAPSLRGKVAVVTGASSGIGLAAARVLVAKGAHVVLACRNEAKGRAAVREVLADATGPDGGNAELMLVDVSDLSSVRAFSSSLLEVHPRIDILINNAGVMTPHYAVSADGLELQFATNHLGHFLLTSLLLDALKASNDARVVTVSSLSHRNARYVSTEMVQSPEKPYHCQLVYANSKLYNLLFALELDRRLKARGVTNVRVSSSHPGCTKTNFLASTLAGSNWFVRFVLRALGALGQQPEMGILPILYAATAPLVPGGEFYGPDGFHNMWGHPTVERPQNPWVTEQVAKDVAKDVWEKSEMLANHQFVV